MSPGSEAKRSGPQQENWRVGISGIVGSGPSDIDLGNKEGNFFECSFKRAMDNRIPSFNVVPSIGLVVPNREDSNLQLPLPPGMSFVERAPAPWGVPDSCSSYPRQSLAMKGIVDYPPFQVPANVIARPHVNSIHSVKSNDSECGGYMTAFFHSMPNGGPNRDPIERRLRSQERNRLAAMKSRQRKKKEWERLIKAESALLTENASLKEELGRLREELLRMREDRSEIRDS